MILRVVVYCKSKHEVTWHAVHLPAANRWAATGSVQHVPEIN